MRKSAKMSDIDVEDENILTSIFKDSFPESWHENPEFVEYLVELSSYGVERLAREPERLAEEKSHILSETQDLAFHNYTTFIETSDCSKEIFQDFQIIEQHLDGLLNKLPTFSDECTNVIHKAQEISSSRRMNTLTLQRHTQLLEILEMPQLMDTCVRNGYYEEALELSAHVKRLEKKHPNIPVIAGIVQEVKASTQLMLNQLIQQLRTNLQLPACLRVIGFLRRMDVFSEAELRIKFLQARDSWFQSILDTIPKGDAYTHINKTIESSRVHLFDIMTQFRAIFSDEDPLVSTGKDDGVNESLLFQSWVLTKISQFLATLEADLNQGVGGRLDAILGQCMYFGLSFSRVGADFRGLLAPIFERAALRYFKASLKVANQKFEENMQSYNLLGISTTGGLPFGMSSSQSGQLFPPTSLLDFYPLAALCNHVLSAFNDLRLCAPVNLACPIADHLKECLMEANRVILAFYRAEETTFNGKEKDQFEQFCASYAADLMPYINKCLQQLFPPSQLATALGLTVSELARVGTIGVLDMKPILDNISHLLPSAPPPPPPTMTTTIEDESEPAGQPVTFTLTSDEEDNAHAATPGGRVSANAGASESASQQQEVTSDINGTKASEGGEGGAIVERGPAGVEDTQQNETTTTTTSSTPPLSSASQQQQHQHEQQQQEQLQTDVSDPGVASSEKPVAAIAEQQQQQEKQEQLPITSSSENKPPPPVTSTFAAANDESTEVVTPSQGGWEEEDAIDLDNLDDVATETSDIDLDLLPTPGES